MLKQILAILITHMIYSSAFINSGNLIGCACNERTIYKNYLLGLRKTRKLLVNTTNTFQLQTIINLTSNYTQSLSHPLLYGEQKYINNSKLKINNIMMGNLILDVSEVKHIHIKTKKDTIILELDRYEENNIINNINNVDRLVNTISLLAQILNVG